MRSGRKDTQQGREASAAVEGWEGKLCGGRLVLGSGAPCTSLSPPFRVLCSSGAVQVEDGATKWVNRAGQEVPAGGTCTRPCRASPLSCSPCPRAVTLSLICLHVCDWVSPRSLYPDLCCCPLQCTLTLSCWAVEGHVTWRGLRPCGVRSQLCPLSWRVFFFEQVI